MKHSFKSWQFLGFAFTSLMGTILHFLYDWLDMSTWIAPFSAVNESTWEHMKILFWPMLLFAFFEWFFFKERTDFWCIKLRGILLGLILIPTIFYTLKGVIGGYPDWLNIAIFFIAAALSYRYEAKLFDPMKIGCKSPKLSLSFLVIISLLFIIFTFEAPEIAIFKDPLTGTYGI